MSDTKEKKKAEEKKTSDDCHRSPAINMQETQETVIKINDYDRV